MFIGFIGKYREGGTFKLKNIVLVEKRLKKHFHNSKGLIEPL